LIVAEVYALIQIRLEAQKAHEDEMKVIFSAERERIEDECKKLRQQLVAAAAEVTSH